MIIPMEFLFLSCHVSHVLWRELPTDLRAVFGVNLQQDLTAYNAAISACSQSVDAWDAWILRPT